MNILLIEDSLFIAAVVRTHLEKVGHKVEVRNSVASSRQRLKGPPPDLLLLDWILPDGNADELLAEVFSAWPATKVVVTTALTVLELPILPLKVSVLLKPYTIPRLLTVVNSSR